MSEGSAAVMQKKAGTKGKKAAAKPAASEDTGAKVSTQSEDLISTTSTQLENLSQKEAFALVPELHDTVDHAYFKLGGVLAVIQTHEWWKDGGYENFKQLVENRFGIKYRKAMYLIGIYAALVESGVPYEAFGNIGWTKVKEIASIVTKENVTEWVEKAALLTVLQLQEAVKAVQSGTLAKSDSTPTTTGVSTFTCKVHDDQKETINKAIEKAMKEADTEHKGVALEAVCMNYLSGAKVAKPKPLLEILKANDPEEILKAFEKAFPDIELSATFPD